MKLHRLPIVACATLIDFFPASSGEPYEAPTGVKRPLKKYRPSRGGYLTPLQDHRAGTRPPNCSSLASAILVAGSRTPGDLAMA